MPDINLSPGPSRKILQIFPADPGVTYQHSSGVLARRAPSLINGIYKIIL